jgi:hypothetical protein
MLSHASAHPDYHAQQLRRRVRQARLDPRRSDRYLPGDDLPQPVCSDSPSSGTSPSCDTRLSSSKRAEPAVNPWETRLKVHTPLPDAVHLRIAAKVSENRLMSNG